MKSITVLIKKERFDNMGELSVYNQLTIGIPECLTAMKKEIGLKSNCIPFAVKIIEALKTLDIKTDQERLNAVNTLMSGLQTLMQGGILAEDYDKIDLVKHGKTIVPTARVEAFLRAAARKGYRITDTIIAVPKDDKETTYFKETFFNGDFIYTLEDRRFQPNREVTAKNIISGYFSKFICRLDIHEIATNKRIVMTACEMSNEEMLTIVNTSEQGFYKSEWIPVTSTWNGKTTTKNTKVLTEKLNTNTFWVKWTGEMAAKTIIRRALKRVKEVLPELSATIYAFEQDTTEIIPELVQAPIIELPIETPNINLNKLTADEKTDVKELLAIWKTNPKLAADSLAEIKSLLENKTELQTVINSHYASIMCLKKSAAKWKQIKQHFEGI